MNQALLTPGFGKSLMFGDDGPELERPRLFVAAAREIVGRMKNRPGRNRARFNSGPARQAPPIVAEVTSINVTPRLLGGRGCPVSKGCGSSRARRRVRMHFAVR